MRAISFLLCNKVLTLFLLSWRMVMIEGRNFTFNICLPHNKVTKIINNMVGITFIE